MSPREDEQIAEWHFQCFSKLDLSIPTIEKLLTWGTEPHEVHRLIVARCPEEVMLRILQPLDVASITPESVRV